MKKNIVIIVLTIVSIVSIIFGYTQKQKAGEFEALAKEYSNMAEEERKRAEIASMEAVEQRKIVELAQQTTKEYSEKAIQELQRMRNEAEMMQKNQ